MVDHTKSMVSTPNGSPSGDWHRPALMLNDRLPVLLPRMVAADAPAEDEDDDED
jgi:hypothetical protein